MCNTARMSSYSGSSITLRNRQHQWPQPRHLPAPAGGGMQYFRPLEPHPDKQVADVSLLTDSSEDGKIGQ